MLLGGSCNPTVVMTARPRLMAEKTEEKMCERLLEENNCHTWCLMGLRRISRNNLRSVARRTGYWLWLRNYEDQLD